MTSPKINSKVREFLNVAMASGCAVAAAHDVGATTVTGGQNGVPTYFGDAIQDSYLLPAGTTEVIGKIQDEGVDWFEFQDVAAGNFTINVASSHLYNELFRVFGDVYDSTYVTIDENGAYNGATFSFTGTTPGNGDIVVGLASEHSANFDATISVTSGTPEPETWTMMTAGALATGSMLRRKRRLTLHGDEVAA